MVIQFIINAIAEDKKIEDSWNLRNFYQGNINRKKSDI